MAEAALRTEGLSRSFGGLAAVADVSLACASGQVHAVIGPNGAGKSTLINMLSGDLAPSSGRVELFGEDITGLPPERVSQRGVGRSYQKTNVFLGFSAFENCRLAAQSRLPSSMRFFRRAERYEQVNRAARRALDAAGLGARGEVLALLAAARKSSGADPRRRDLLIENLHRIQDRYGRLSAAHLAALAEAIYTGLFGVKLAGGVLDLDVRLLDRTGRVELQQPATQTRVAYRYRFEPAARRITLEAETNARPGRVRIVVPPDFGSEVSVGIDVPVEFVGTVQLPMVLSLLAAAGIALGAGLALWEDGVLIGWRRRWVERFG